MCRLAPLAARILAAATLGSNEDTHMAQDVSHQDIGKLDREVDLSVEQTSVTYNYVRSRQLEGTFPGDQSTGTWLVSSMRISRGWGAVLESDWPRIPDEDWPPCEPPGLDSKAKSLRCHHYQRIRSVRDCARWLADGMPVQASFEITKQWYGAERGTINMPEPDEETVGSHCVLIVGFDVLGRCFRFVNSWGEAWGQHGIGHLPIEYFEKYFVSSWARTGIGMFPDYLKVPGIADVMWRQPDFLGHSVHGGDTLWGCEVHNGITDEHMGWAFAVHREGHLDVEELFVRPQFRGQGIANRLVKMLLETAAKVRLPLRMWIPFADWTESNVPAIEKITSKLGLSLFETNERWAAAVAMYPQGSPEQLGASAKRIPPGSVELGKRLPSRPASICAMEAPSATPVSAKHFETNRYPLRGTPVTYRDPTAPVAESDWGSLR